MNSLAVSFMHLQLCKNLGPSEPEMLILSKINGRLITVTQISRIPITKII